MGIYNKNILNEFSKPKIYFPSLLLFIVLLFATTAATALPYYEYLRKTFTIVGIVVVFNTANILFNNDSVLAYFKNKAKYVFLIYVTHIIYILGWLKGAFWSSPLANTGWGMLLSFFLIPAITILIIIGIYHSWEKVAPRSFKFCTRG